jgi:asparagine synthetase A
MQWETVVGDEAEVVKVLKAAEDEVKDIYTSTEMLIEKVYEFLLKNEVIHKEDIKKIKDEKCLTKYYSHLDLLNFLNVLSFLLQLYW